MKSVTRSAWLALAVVVSGALAGVARGEEAALRLPFILSDNMVLQRDLADPVWGWAKAGDEVKVEFAGQTKTAKADDSGRWEVKLGKMPASSEGREMTITAGKDGADGAIHLKNILVGEVWLASGQSNMEKPIGEQRGQQPTVNWQEEIANANHPLIRIIAVPKRSSTTQPITSQWEACSPESVVSEHFSAAAYFFGRKIQQELGVPVGLIDSSWGGTRIEPWTPKEGFEKVPELKEFAEAAEAARPQKVDGTVPGQLYDRMIRPMVPMGIRGAIWYQGENNVLTRDGEGYRAKMKALVEGWRAVWGEGEFPFYYVQIAPFHYSKRRAWHLDAEELPKLWDAQRRALEIPNTGMVVITDLVDNLKDIHPTRKKEVGERLADWALARTYDKKGIAYSGPLFRKAEFKGKDAVVEFEHGKGLKSRDGKALSDFQVAGADGKFVPAEAKVEGETVVVSSPEVSEAKAVRLGWDESAEPNLVNGAGLPASPFTSEKP